MWESQRDKKFNFGNFLQIDELTQTHSILFRIRTPINGCGLKDATKAFFVYPNLLIIFLSIRAKQYRGLMPKSKASVRSSTSRPNDQLNGRVFPPQNFKVQESVATFFA